MDPKSTQESGSAVVVDHREEMRKIFRGDPSAKVVWQPRIEHWFHMNRKAGTLPESLAGYETIDVYRDLQASMRYLPCWSPVKHIHDSSVTEVREVDGDTAVYRCKTPVGEIRKVERSTAESCLTEEFFVKNLDDLRVAQYLVESTTFEPNAEAFESDLREFAPWGMSTAVIPRVNVMRIFIEYFGFEGGIYALHDSPTEIRAFTDVMDASDLRYLDALLQTPVEFINYGDNIHCDMLPPPLLEAYVMPAYHQRNEPIHAAGRYCYSHWDGDVRTIIPYARETGMDGIEAITFKPMGDATFEMIEEHMGKDMVFVDGICATSFLPQFSMEEFEAETRELIERLHPKLVLGVSDEPPPGSEYAKLQRVTEIVAEYNAKL